MGCGVVEAESEGYSVSAVVVPLPQKCTPDRSVASRSRALDVQDHRLNLCLTAMRICESHCSRTVGEQDVTGKQ